MSEDSTPQRTYRAFGLTLTTDMVLPWPAVQRTMAGPAVHVAVAPAQEVSDAWSGSRGEPTWETVFPGQRRVVVERGVAGDQLIRHAERDAFLLSPRADQVLCAPGRLQEPSWQRFLYDTVLWWTSLANGLHILHASAVETDAGVVAFISPSGGGKSTLAGEFMGRGAALFSDDILALESSSGVRVHPGPPLMNVAVARRQLIPSARQLALLDEGEREAWVAVERASFRPRSLRALFLYTRAPGLSLEARATQATVLELMPHAWGIPDQADALASRFAALSELAMSVPVFHLTADASTPVGAIADVVERVCS